MVSSRELASQFTGRPPCTHCGGYHARSCPRVKRIIFRSPDDVQEVEYFPAKEWPEDFPVVWPEELADLEDQDELEVLEAEKNS